ncbi:MAG TPA: hypothetical protein PLT09_13180 [Deltaproteobacteria bacterium]|nr:hypothetical protein [Deltaproteobacteria bacterium]
MYKNLWIVLIFLFIAGCSNDSIFEGMSQNSSHDATIEEAALALDKGDYDTVVSDLASIYTTSSVDPQVGRLLASAYMGQTGVDITCLIAHSTSSGLDPLDAMASLLSSADITTTNDQDYIDGTLMSDYLNAIIDAKDVLELLVDYGKASDDDVIQLGIASAVHFVLYIGNQTADALNKTLDYADTSKQDPGSVPVPMNCPAYQYYYSGGDGYSWSRVDSSDYEKTAASGSATSYQQDLLNISRAVIAFSNAYPGENSMKGSLNAFLSSALGVDADSDITDDLIMTYTSDGVNAYVQRTASQN